MRKYISNLNTKKYNHISLIRFPGVFFDVDGVLKKGKEAIPGSKEALIRLRENNIPFAIITNGGGETESSRSNALNNVLNLDNEDLKIKPDEVFLCHSPMKPILNKTEKMILVTGTGNVKSVMKEYNHSKYLTVEEYAVLFPNFFCHFFVEELNDDPKIVRKEVENRLQLELRSPPNIEAIFMMTDVIRWEMNVQLFSDLLISNNGIPGTIRRPEEPQKVEFHLCSHDLVYKDNFVLPRIAAGAFWYSLEHLFFMKYKRKIDFILYGKPSPTIFNYAKQEISKKYKERISHFYMVGDNPPVDIKGANDSDILSILVKTGVFQGLGNDIENPAKFVVQNSFDAVDLIFKLEYN